MSVHVCIMSFEPPPPLTVGFRFFSAPRPHNQRCLRLELMCQSYFLLIWSMRAVGMRYEPGLWLVALFTPPAL